MIINGFIHTSGILEIIITVIKAALLWIAFDNLKNNKVDYWWLNITFFIYATHNNIGRVWGTLWRLIANKFMPASLAEFVAFIMSLGFTLATCIAVAYVWRRISQYTFSIVTGDRN